MSKLLRAEFSRFSRCLIWKICMLAAVGLGALYVWTPWYDGQQYPGYTPVYWDVVFVGGFMMAIGMAAFVGLFVGTEYADGTIRNKLLVGHRRLDVYLTEFVVCAAGNLLMCAAYTLTVLLLGSVLIGPHGLKLGTMLILTAATVTGTLAATALLVLIAMNVQGKAAGCVACLLVTGALIFGAAYIDMNLVAPEYVTAYTMADEETGMMQAVERRNPSYLTGAKRRAFEVAQAALPVSQLFVTAVQAEEKIPVVMAYSVAELLLLLCTGVVLFENKDLK